MKGVRMATDDIPSDDLPRTVGLVGAGRMGCGIAHAYLAAGRQVVLVDSNPKAMEVAAGKVERMLERTAQRTRLGEPVTALMERLQVAGGLTAVGGSDLVIEAVPESLNLKRSVLAEVERHIGESTVVATNTSSMSVTELGGSLKEPERFIGMHFFNPVPSSALVEVVVGKRTDQATVAIAGHAVEVIGKTAITVYDSPGFVSSRLGVLLGLEAIRMVEDGVASAEDIDRAMVLGYRHPMGPLALTDLVGLDVRLGIAEYLQRALGPRFEPPQLLRRMVAAGLLGRTTGQGFFRYDDETAR